MKKLLLFAVAAFAMLATSCSKDADVVAPVEKGTVTFAVATPQLATRAKIGDGETATTLHYAVYDENWNHLEAFYGTKEINISTTVQFDLVDGKTYNFLFWAQNAAAPYTFNPDTKKVTVDYAGIKSNNEQLDAFFAPVEGVKVSASLPQQNVDLYRPFAQLNIATSDWDKFTASEESFTQTEVKVSAYSTLDLVSGDVSDAQERVFNFAQMPAEEFAYDGKNYKWLSMNYLLVDGKELVKVTFNANNANVEEKSWNNVPVERNYRTNIIGSLLTSTTDFKITIRPDFEEPAHTPEATTVVTTSTELAAAIAAAGNDPTTIELKAGTYQFDQITIGSKQSIHLKQALTTSTVAESSTTGVTLDGQFAVTGELYIDGMTITNASATSSGNSKFKDNAISLQSEGEVVITNSTFNLAKNSGIVSWWSTGKQTNVIVKNCVFNCNGFRPLQIEANATIEGCTFNDPYRYCAQLTCSDAVINFKNNTINQATTSGKPTYGLQLTSDYGNKNLVINGEGNVINKRGADDALYVWELGTGTSNGYVDIATITLNATDGVFYVLDGDTFAIGISSVEELKEFAAEVNAGNNFAGKNIVLLNDIDLENAAWTPIGNGSKAFKGNFNGLNHTIKNLNIVATSSYAGLFGYTFGGNLIENLVIENINATGTSYLGGVVGCAYTTSLKNITIQGDVFIDCSGQDIGALTGYTYGTLTDITVNVNEGSYVKGHSYFGGVVGYRGEGAITYTRVKSNIDVIGKAYMIGGITGMAQYGNKFVDCECSGNVSLTEGDPTSANRWMRIGGIAGSWMDGNDTYVVTLENCAFTGTLSSMNTDGDYVTEFDHNGYVGRSYNTSNKGKLIINGVESVEPIFIATAEKLVDFAESVNAGNTYAGKKVVISKDIDLEGIEWTPIGTSTINMFAGEFDGKGHSIKNLSVKRVERYGNGFFGNLSGKAVIKNITFDNAYVGNGDSQFNGNMYAIVAGYIYGSGYFENVHVVNSEVHGYGKVAAFVGQVADPGAHTMTIKNCSVENTDIYGVYNVAKLVGLVQRGVSVVVENTDVSSAKFVKADGEIYEDIVDATVTEATSGDTMVVSGNFWVYGEYLYAGFAEHYCDYEVGHLDYRFEDGRYYGHGTTH